jgi:DNA-binding transcriptional LysR family regulator
MNQLLAMRVFSAVVESGSFSKAAERLNISTTAASKHVSDLERHLQAHLLLRSTRRLTVTAQGQKYFECSQQILAQLDEADAMALETASTPSGFMRISLPVSFGMRYVAPLIQQFSELYPEIHLEVQFADHLVDMVDEGIDVAVRIASEITPTLVARRLATVRLVAHASPSYLMKYGCPRVPEDLKNHRCLSYCYSASGETWRFRDGNVEIPVAIKPVFQANSGDMIQQMSIAGGGIALQPTFIIGDDLRAGRLVHLLANFDPAPRAVYAVYQKGARRSSSVRTFVSFLAEQFGSPIPVWDADLPPPYTETPVKRMSVTLEATAGIPA